MIRLAKFRLQKQSVLRVLSLFTVVVLIFSALLIYLPKHASAAIAFDKNLGSNNNGSCSSSLSFSTATNAAANTKIIVVSGAYGGGSNLSFTISGGGLSWHTDKTTISTTDQGDEISVASADAPSGLAASTSITVTYSPAPSGWCYIAGSSFTGLATGTSNDGTNLNGPSIQGSQFWNGGSITTTGSNDLIFGFGLDDNVNTWSGASCTPSTSYTNIHCGVSLQTTTNAYNDVYQIVSSAGGYSPGGQFVNAIGGANETSGLSVAYKATDIAPNTPTLTSPISGATAVSTKPTFSFNDTDPDGDDIQFTINLFQSNCSTSVSTFSMSSGQTGWSPTFNGTAGSGKTYKSSTAGSGVSFTTSTGLSPATTYCWSVSAKDPAGTNTTTTSGTQLFTTDSAPSAPSLLAPSNGQIGLKTTPTFNLSGTESDGDYLNYEIQICSTNNCSSVVRTICEVSDAANSCTGSQAGWASQSQQSGTAYLSGQTAIYNYQFTDLSPNTQYWWRGSEIDPGGSNTWSSASSISSFTIENLSTSHDINVGGTVNVQGNVCFGSC